MDQLGRVDSGPVQSEMFVEMAAAVIQATPRHPNPSGPTPPTSLVDGTKVSEGRLDSSPYSPRRAPTLRLSLLSFVSRGQVVVGHLKD